MESKLIEIENPVENSGICTIWGTMCMKIIKLVAVNQNIIMIP